MTKWNFLKRLKPENESFTTDETKRIEIDQFYEQEDSLEI